MAYLIVVILDNIQCMPEIISTWRSIGVSGVTIIESTGAHRVTTWLSQVGLGAIDHLFEADEIRRRTLLAVVDNEELMEQAVAEVDRIVGGFEKPETGLVLALPLTVVKGLHKEKPVQTEDGAPSTGVQSEWFVQRNTPVSVVVDILKLKPTIVDSSTPLNEVALAMIEHPNSHVASVVKEDGRLIGLLGLRRLTDDLFFHIMPEEFLSELSDLDHAMKFAEMSRMRTAKDAMQDPVWVFSDDTIFDAFDRMHENKLSGLPVVDHQYRVIGYINLLELLAVCLRSNKGKEEGK